MIINIRFIIFNNLIFNDKINTIYINRCFFLLNNRINISEFEISIIKIKLRLDNKFFENC